MTGRRRALLGMQAQYEHSPPTSSLSTTAVERPAARARSATFSPTGPAPSTTTSYAMDSVSVMGPVWLLVCSEATRVRARNTPPRGGVVHTGFAPRPEARHQEEVVTP